MSLGENHVALTILFKLGCGEETNGRPLWLNAGIKVKGVDGGDLRRPAVSKTRVRSFRKINGNSKTPMHVSIPFESHSFIVASGEICEIKGIPQPT